MRGGLRTVLLGGCEVFVCITIILVVEWDLAFLLLVGVRTFGSRIGVNSHEDVSNDEYV